LNFKIGAPPKTIDWVFLIAHLGCIVLGKGIIGYLVILSLAGFSWYKIVKGDFYLTH